MKLLRTSIAVILFSPIAFTCPAQQESSVFPKWVSDKGYWVVESNIKTPLHHIIRFYTNENVLMYTETVDGIQLNPDKRKVKIKLKKALEVSALTWHDQKQTQTDKGYVKTLLK